MTPVANLPALDAQARARIAASPDRFIAARLPVWLKQASPAQINRLRDGFKAHYASQAQARAVTQQLIPLQRFAELHLQQLLRDLPTRAPLAELQWLEVRRRFTVAPGITLPQDELLTLREPALLRLMHNFEQGASFYIGSGLVEQDEDTLIQADLDALVSACRALDAGARYQRLVQRVFTPANCAVLASDKRAGMRLAIELAALRGDLDAHQQIAMLEVASGEPRRGEQGLRAYPGLMKMLGCALADALLVQLRDAHGADAGLVLYLPSAATRPLRFFANRAALDSHLLQALRQAEQREFFSQLVSLAQRAAFITLLSKRLQDPQPDLAVEGEPPSGELFDALVARQVQRVRADAEVLLVPTARVDAQAAERRRASWRAVGLGLANLAGLFSPWVGAVLLGQFVVQILGEVFEGASDWLHGHQHEAVEHMLGVAEDIAVSAAMGAGAALVARGFAASDFVAALEPVALGGAEQRLWANDLAPYRSEPEQTLVQQDGLHAAGERRWLRLGGHAYEVHRPLPEGPWRLRHPARIGAYGPPLEFNGERGWRLRGQRPLESDDAQQLIASLWCGRGVLDRQRSAQILSAALVDIDELRGVCVENRRLPVNLRDTLERFEAQARVEAFFGAVAQGVLPASDSQILTWCRVRLPSASTAQALLTQLQAQAGQLRGPLLAHLAQVEPGADPLLGLLQRDFAGLTGRYAQALVHSAAAGERSASLGTGRLAPSLARTAAALLRLARLCRARAGLFLADAYSDETGELVMALLPRLAHWPGSLQLELCSDALGGRRLAVLGRHNPDGDVLRLAATDGRFAVHDSSGQRLAQAVDEPAGLLQAIVALLSPSQRRAMGLAGAAAAQRLREQLIAALPVTQQATERLLGWPQREAWFNPGRRLPDGRVGYPLSGRGSRRRSPHSVLRDRLRGLYPGLADDALDQQLAGLLADPRAPFDVLLALEDEYAELDVHLNRWVGAELDAPRRHTRQRMAERLRRAWRLQAEPGQVAGEQRLHLLDLAVSTLPELPGQVQFRQLTGLSLQGTRVSVVRSDFLAAFTGLRELNLSNNQLLRVPAGVAYLPALRRLRLAHNAIRLDAGALDALNGLPELTELDLSFNPLGAYHLRYQQLPRLRQLNLRHCRLGEWPSGIELCGELEQADLRDNQLSDVPQQLLRMPHAFRRVFLVQRNPIRMRDLRGLYALDPIQEHLHSPEPVLPIDPEQNRLAWLAGTTGPARSARAAQWDELLARPENASLFQLLWRLQQTAEFSQHRTALAERVWTLLGAVHANDALGQGLAELAGLPLTCRNSVAERFSDLHLRASLDAAQRNTQPARGEALLALGRGLFNLERLELRVRQAVNQHAGAAEPVTLRLFYRMRLREALGLPSQPLAIDYSEGLMVSQADLDQVRRRVLEDLSVDNLAENLSQRTFWQTYQQQLHADAFAALAQQDAQRHAELQARREQLPAEEYAWRLEHLAVELASQRHALIVSRTRQWLIGRQRRQG